MKINFSEFFTVIIAAIIVATSTILTGCAGKIADHNPGATEPPTENISIAPHLPQQENNLGDNPALQLLTVSELLHQGELEQATLLLNTIKPPLTHAQNQEYLLIQSELALANDNHPSALNLSGQISPEDLSTKQKIRYYQIQITANLGRSPLSVIYMLIAQEPLLQPDQRQSNIDQTWDTLNQLPQATKEQLSGGDTLAGWLELTQFYQTYKDTPSLLQTHFSSWQNKYPQHPARLFPPRPFADRIETHTNPIITDTAITSLPEILPLRGLPPETNKKKIALLLPLSGNAKLYSEAIEQGFRAAAAGQSSIPEISLYDSSSAPLPELFEHFEQEGINLVVGPLLKSQVEQLATLQTSINVLALNQPEKPNFQPNICYFALSPEDEAIEAASHILSQGKQLPLLLLPEGELGQRVAIAFTNRWQQAGGTKVLVQTFGPTSTIKAAIDKGIGIKLTGKEVNDGQATDQFSASSPSSLNSTPREIDAVYIVANPAEIALLKPALDMNNATRPQLYTSSRSYPYAVNTTHQLELEDVEYSEIPLLAGAYPDLQQQIIQQFDQDYMQVRLYAMGIDAWSLINQFDSMQQNNAFQFDGYTGAIHLDSHCVIKRSLPWLKFHQGQVIRVP